MFQNSDLVKGVSPNKNVFRKLLLVIAIETVAYGSTDCEHHNKSLYQFKFSSPAMDRNQFLFFLLTFLCFCPSSCDLFNEKLFENEKITNFIKDQFYENCFGTESFNLINTRIRRAKSQCKSSSTTTPRTTKAPTTTSPAASLSTSKLTTSTSAPASTTSRWSWMPPTVAQFPTFQNSHLVNPFQFYPQTFQYKVSAITVIKMP